MSKTYSKKDLAIKFGISPNTVVNTIKHCGLDTAKTTYDESEVKKFAEARDLLESGQTFQGVAILFGVHQDKKKAETVTDYSANEAAVGAGEGVIDLVDNISDALAASIEEALIPATVVKLSNRLNDPSSKFNQALKGLGMRFKSAGYDADGIVDSVVQKCQKALMSEPSVPQLTGISTTKL